MKIIQRSISEVGQEEKVQIHFKFNDQKKGYAEIARVHNLDNTDIYMIIREIENLRAFRSANPKVKHALRRMYVKRPEKKKTKTTKDPRPDDRKKAVTRELNLSDWENDNPRRKNRNDAMAIAFKNALSLT